MNCEIGQSRTYCHFSDINQAVRFVNEFNERIATVWRGALMSVVTIVADVIADNIIHRKFCIMHNMKMIRAVI